MRKTKQKLEKVAMNATSWIGSIESLILHTIVFAISFSLVLFGIAIDRVLLVLTTVLSLEAIYLAIFIQMSVNQSALRLAQVETNIEDMAEDVEEIAEDVEGIEKEMVEMAEDVEGIQEDMEHIEKDIDEIQEDVQGIEKEVIEIGDNVEEMAEDVEHMEKDIDEMQDDVEEIQEDIEKNKIEPESKLKK